MDSPYVAALDETRLALQRERVKHLMADGQWRTLWEISRVTGAPEASASAQLRNFRKARHGGHEVKRRRKGRPEDGLWEYQLILREV